MLRLHRHADEIRQVDSVSGSIHTISRNAITDYYRAAARRELPVDGSTPATRPTRLSRCLTGAAPGELTGCLEPLLARLSPTYREALQLTDLDGLTQAEAGARLGLSTSGMKSRVQRARNQLRDQFSDCCDIHLDRRGGVIDYQSREGGGCVCSTAPRAATASEATARSRVVGRR